MTSPSGFLVLLILCIGFGAVPVDVYEIEADEDNNVTPLFLTPLIEAGQIVEAQELSRVQPDIGGVRSYSGYFTVNVECESSLFFWFFPTQVDWEAAPVVLWVQGGPGTSFGIGLFDVIGLFTYNGTLQVREHSWNKKNNLLFIEMPVGTGYSFTDKECYSNSSTDNARNVYSALFQFYRLFPSMSSNKLVLAGESYAGHFVPALGLEIHQQNKNAAVKINLASMIIGNGWMDAFYQEDFGNFFYYLGLIDDIEKNNGDSLRNEFVEFLKKEDWKNAVAKLREIDNFYTLITGRLSPFDYTQTILTARQNAKPSLWVQYMQSPDTRKALKTGNYNYSVVSQVAYNLLQFDQVQSVKPMIETLLEYYTMVFFHGQLDPRCPYPLAANLFNSLNWTGSSSYRTAPRHQWCVDGQLAGYYKGSHNLYDVLVRNAGHSVPEDQPLWAYILADSVIYEAKGTPLHGLTLCPTDE